MISSKKKSVANNTAQTVEGKSHMVKEEYWRQPLDDSVPLKKEGNIHVIKNRCKGCAFCIEFCPKKVLVQSENINEKGYHPPDVEHLDKCVFCGLCEMICPDFAIYIEVTKSNEDEINNNNNKKKNSKDK